MVQYRLEFGRGVGGLGWRKPESWVFWFNPVMRGKSTGKVTSVLVATVTSVTSVTFGIMYWSGHIVVC